MASSSENELTKVGKKAFAFLDNLKPRKKKMQNGSGNKESVIDANQAARMYGGYLFTYPAQVKTVECPMAPAQVKTVERPMAPAQVKTVERPMAKAGVYQYNYQSAA